MIRHEQHKEIWNVIKDIPVAMLCTAEDGILRSRPMHVVQKDFSGTLYFFAAQDASVISEITKERQVNLSFASKASGTYLSLSGVARICSDKNKVDELWNDDMELLFPKGKDGGEALLLEIPIHQGESWNVHKGLTRFNERLRASTDNVPADMARNEKYEL